MKHTISAPCLLQVLHSVLIFCCTLINIEGKASTLPAGFSETLVAQGLDPTDLLLLPDGRIFITIKSGKVVIIEDGILRTAPLISIEQKVDNYNERGLGHIVLDPNFESNGYYYLYYTVKGENHNRVSRFTAIGNFSDPASEYVVFDLDVMAGTIHNAGDMAFTNDGKLIISVGDGSSSNTAQSLTTVLGKILRINPDGTVPTDNPFDAQTSGKNKAIFALGLRNPFSLTIDALTGAIFVSEVGQESWEEVNRIEAGKNYGWPGIEGKRTTQSLPAIGTYVDPILAYPHGSGLNAGCAVVGSAVYRSTSGGFPASYQGRLFFSDYCNGYIKSMKTDGSDVQVFAQNIDRPLAIVVDDAGTMSYLARGGLGGGSETDNTSSNDGTLWKVTATGSGVPVISVPPQNALVSVGETATFSVSATGAAPLSYQWQANEVDIAGAIAANYAVQNAQISDDGKRFRCVVTNSSGSVTSVAATLSVTTNTRPEPEFAWHLPADATLYEGGQTLTFSGSATDAEDGALPQSALTWKINFFHEQHFHPAMAAISGINSLFYDIPKVGETSANVWYRIYLTATDLGNPALSKTIYKDVYPHKVHIALSSQPSHLNVLLDGRNVITPYTFEAVAGTQRALEVSSSQSRNDSLLIFKNWADGTTARNMNVDVPSSDKMYQVNYDFVPRGNGIGLKGYYYTAQDRSFNGPATLIRIDPKIDFDWHGGSPDPMISNDHFTVRWVGEVLPLFTDTYTFYLKGDDGIRLWVNDVAIIDKWIDQAATEWSGSIELQQGVKYPIRIEYYENGGDAAVSLLWSCSKLDKQILPGSQLSTDVTTSIEDSESGWTVFPTITSGDIHVECNVSGHQGAWALVDMIGHVWSTGTMSNSFVIDASACPPGIYVVKTNRGARKVLKR